MNFKNINFMNQKYTSNDIQNDEFTHDNQDIDYQNLITRLKEISTTIALLEKTIFREI